MKSRFALAVLAAALVAWMPRAALAHCDTLDGPVVKDARVALESKDVTPVFKWVRADAEAEIRDAFQQALKVRALGGEAGALADRYFFETLVRVHRAGEGAPYTGLKPAGVTLEPAIAASDAALESGAVEPLVSLLTSEVAQGLRQRHARVLGARAHAAHSVDAGRRYVAAYVEFVHYAERLGQAAAEHTENAGHVH